MKLCGFEAGIDHPFFLIAGRSRSAEQGPRREPGMRPRSEMRAGGESGAMS